MNERTYRDSQKSRYRQFKLGQRSAAQQNYRGEIFSRRLKYTAEKSYFFNLKENREAEIYLNIVESRQATDEGYGFQRHSILIFVEQRQSFVSQCLEALEALAQGKNFQGEVKSKQRQFNFQMQQKRGKAHNMYLAIRESSQHYGKPLQQQIKISQNYATIFSQALIETVEIWLQQKASTNKRDNVLYNKNRQ